LTKGREIFRLFDFRFLANKGKKDLWIRKWVTKFFLSLNNFLGTKTAASFFLFSSKKIVDVFVCSLDKIIQANKDKIIQANKKMM
jgi:hypothetical protein